MSEVKRACPQCGRMLEEKFIVCPYCGRSLKYKPERRKGKSIAKAVACMHVRRRPKSSFTHLFPHNGIQHNLHGVTL